MTDKPDKPADKPSMVEVDRETLVLTCVMLAMHCEPQDIREASPRLWDAVASYMGPQLARGAHGIAALEIQKRRDSVELIKRIATALAEPPEGRVYPPADDYEIRDLLAAAADMEPSARSELIRRVVPMLVARLKEAERIAAGATIRVEAVIPATDPDKFVAGFVAGLEAVAEAEPAPTGTAYDPSTKVH